MTVGAVRSWVRDRPVTAFAVLACAVSWAWWLPMIARGEVVQPGSGWPTHLPGLAGPAVAALVVTAAVDGRRGVRALLARVGRWRVGVRWWAVVVATAALALLGLVVPAVTGDDLPSAADFARYSGVGELGLPAVVLVSFVVNGLGEETGWRGCAADRLLDRFGLRGTALVVAGAWAVWHLPLFWVNDSFRSFGPLGTTGWLVGLAAGSVVLTWLYRGSGRSILLVAAWHTAFNLTSATEATSDVVAPLTTTLVIVAAVWLLRREHATPPARRRSAA